MLLLQRMDAEVGQCPASFPELLFCAELSDMVM